MIEELMLSLIQNILFIPLIAVSFAGFIVFVFLVILLWRTPAMTYLKASIGGKVLAQVYRRDRYLDLVPTKIKAGSAIDDPFYGLFHVSEDSVYAESKSGVAMILVSTDLGASISPEIAMATMELERRGIKSKQQMQYIEAAYCECVKCKKVDLAVFDKVKQDNKTKELVFEGKTKCRHCDSTELTKLDYAMKYDKKRTFTLGQVKDYMKKINPGFLRAVKERDVDEERQNLKDFFGGKGWLIPLGLVILFTLVGLGVLLTIIGNQQDPVSISQQCQALWNAYSNV